jgi:hypothetical protein
MSKDNDTLPPEADKLKAALETLKAERNRRITEKLESGELQVKVIGCPDANESAVNDDPDAPITRIVTGVPRAPDWGEKWQADAPLLPQYPDRYAATPARAAQPPPKLAPVASEWKRFHLTVTPPSERDMGAIIEARYQTAGAELRLNFQGRIYAEPIGPNDDPLVAARKLLRSKYGRHGEFYGALRYPPRSIH